MTCKTCGLEVKVGEARSEAYHSHQWPSQCIQRLKAELLAARMSKGQISEDLLTVARGCRGHSGGHRGRAATIYYQGVRAVIDALERTSL